MASNLPTTNPIPSVLTNARVYKDAVNQIGLADVELPNFEYMTESVSGLGIGGELDMPVAGHFKTMAVKLKWNTVTKESMSLLVPEAHHLDVRGNMQDYDPSTGKLVNRAVKVVIRSMPKTNGIGKMEPGKKMEPETELECLYIKIWIDGEERVEVDKLNMICVINGVDVLAEVRANLGM